MIFKGIDLITCDKLSYVRLDNGDIREVRCIAYFKKFNWWFMVTEDINNKGFFVVTEASTGCNILEKYCYDDISDAIKDGLQVIENMRYYFATSIIEVRVKYNQNLLLNNLTDTQINMVCV